jgi:pimeloyl-ACP methyl ester carboxylesterase
MPSVSSATIDAVQPLIEHSTRAAGFPTRVLELEGDGPGLVLLHGWGDSADTWRPLLALLGARDRRALAVDLPGYAEAGPLRDGPVLPQLDRFVAELVAEWGGPVVVCGNSLGGLLALRAAAAEVPGLAGIVPIAPAGLEMPRWFDVIERDPVVRRLLALPLPVPAQVTAPLVGAVYRRLAFSSAAAADSALVAGFAGHHPGRAGIARLLASGRRLLPELQAPPAGLASIGCPVRLVWGTRDRMVPHSGAAVVAGALPDADVVLLDGVGHCPQLEATDRLAELLLDFAGRVARVVS